MKGKKQKKLSTIMLFRLMLFSLILITVINIVVAQVVKRETLNIYRDFAFSYTNTVAENIDADVIEEYQKTGKTDEYYDDVEAFLLGMVHGAGLRYLYVFVPEEKGIRYVWDAQLDDDSRPLNDIWYYDGNYPEEEAKEAYRDGTECFSNYTYGDMDLAAAISPLKDSEGKIVALIETDILMPRIRSSMLSIIVLVSVGVCIVMAIAIALFYVFSRRRVVVQLMKIKIAAEEMVSNLDKDERITIDVHTNDELEAVARSFEEMDRKLHDYIDENENITSEKERVNTELNLAAKIQSDMLPSKFPAFPDRPEFTIYADMTPAREVGGDFYDFFFVDHDHLALVMADVSGKGVPAAMFMMMAKSMLRSRAIKGHKPSQVLADVNNMIYVNNQEMMFVTAWLGILDVDTGTIIAANAGHEKPMLYHPGREFELVDDRHGFVLGGKPGMRFHDYELKMEPGSKLFIYTDGVTEATNAELELFELERTLASLNSVKEGAPEDILMAVDRDVYKFVGDVEQFDDLTMLCLEYHGRDVLAPKKKKLRMKELTLDATVEGIEEVTEFVERELRKMDCPGETLGEINTAIDEILGNIASYAYGSGEGPATVRLEIDEEEPTVILTFRDNGMPFDPLKQDDPDTTLSTMERSIGGLGIFMVKNMMDDMNYEYRDGQNVLQITKKIV